MNQLTAHRQDYGRDQRDWGDFYLAFELGES
jgi:hypothetical protein